MEIAADKRTECKFAILHPLLAAKVNIMKNYDCLNERYPCHCPNPIENCANPMENCTIPMENSANPTENCANPVENCANPMENCTNPIVNCTIPMENFICLQNGSRAPATPSI